MTEFSCSKCDICNINDHKPVIGDGDPNAVIMFITGNPSTLEFKKNVPLISKDGMLFQKYLDLFNFNRDYIYITNAVKCRTPGHRFPTDVEISNCRNYLEDEINKVNPRIIVLIGDTALRSYFKLYFTPHKLDINDLNSKCTMHNNRTIIFMLAPIYGVNSSENRVKIYNSFLSVLDVYRKINPTHVVNFNE